MRKRRDGSMAVFPHFLMDRRQAGHDHGQPVGHALPERDHVVSPVRHRDAGGEQGDELDTRLPDRGCGRSAQVRHRHGATGRQRLDAFIADGYLVTRRTIEELAAKLDIDAHGLKDSVARINRFAQTGVDEDFNRGTTAYARNLGDPAWPGPNPNIGPLQQAPYYAVRLYPGDIGAATGFVTDASARVLDGTDKADSRTLCRR